MDDNKENKYQVIDPDSSKYKLTANDLKKEKKTAKKKKHGVLKAVIAIFLVFAIIASGAYIYIDRKYLSKINYNDIQAEVDPDLDKNEAIDFEGQADADENIEQNLNNNIMWYDDRVFNVLLVGYDLGDGAKNYYPRSDSNILLSINKETNVISMVSLSRATYAAIPGHGNKRINTAYAYGGAAMLVDTVQKNHKVRIDKYITVDFNGFKNIIDILGGIDITMDEKEAKYVLAEPSAGTYHLDGEKALAYSRIRWFDSDRARTGRQRAVLNAIAVKLRSSSVQTLTGFLDEMLPLVGTNFSKMEILAQVPKAPSYLSMTIQESVIPHFATPLTLRDGMEVLILDWAKETDYLHKMLYPDMIPQSHQELN